MKKPIYIGECKSYINDRESSLETVKIDKELYYKIVNSDVLRPFFMSIVSDSNHWMFISSNGGLTAGRKDTKNALFPYYTDDKITESNEITGNKTILLVERENRRMKWEPFSSVHRGAYSIQRNIYKNSYGNKIIFEEENMDLGLIYRCQWSSSNIFGFVKTTSLLNTKKHDLSVSLIDGIQNIVPYGTDADFQNSKSNLVDAYKKSEMYKNSGLGVYGLSAIIVDRPEPSEALKANCVWSLGLKADTHLISSLQLDDFRNGRELYDEVDIRAEKGAYFISASLKLKAKEEKEWMIIANVNQGPSAIASLCSKIENSKNLKDEILEDIHLGTKNLIRLTACADGIELTSDIRRNTRHFSNTLFNIMRGGIFDDKYSIDKRDFKEYLFGANKAIAQKYLSTIENFPTVFDLLTLKSIGEESSDPDFNRLCIEYLPLKFSRRHGDPSRPWNKFSINTRSEIDGSKILDYEGNWRDIFQNWEALAHAYPDFVEGMIFKFLNASTFEGYNPYRITKSGFDWEVIEENDPWSYIGYWGDHQIIYLLKLLEIAHNYSPIKLEKYFNASVFVYANVPYKIKSYEETLANPKDTITFDHKSNGIIRESIEKIGADGGLLKNKNNEIHRVNFIEKILATLLAKCSNFIPEGGIWLNTQRPEWNDANNALVGDGISNVTLCYLRRFVDFFESVLSNATIDDVEVSTELLNFFHSIAKTFENFAKNLDRSISDSERKNMVDRLCNAGSMYRTSVYKNSFSGKKTTISLGEIKDFLKTVLPFFNHTIDANKREDNLYHAYNLMTVTDNNKISISRLTEMLEGQVAVLSAGYLTAQESLNVLDSLRQSKLYRIDQRSYLLYPNKDLPRFKEKNNIPIDLVNKSPLLKALLKEQNSQIIEQDLNGQCHFNGRFNNAQSLAVELLKLPNKFEALVEVEKASLMNVFEELFDHKSFTGRSGTFFGYEGLGSIYWHMVSKLALAVQECCVNAQELGVNQSIQAQLISHYREIVDGIGVHKTAKEYGAFPTDPYSHTPAGKGAQQPGMTGQVKEDILTRFGEFGITVKMGKINFNPFLLKKEEFLKEGQAFNYVDVNFVERNLILEKGMLCFTYCQIPIIYELSDTNLMEIHFKDGKCHVQNELQINEDLSKDIFNRNDKIDHILLKLN